MTMWIYEYTTNVQPKVLCHASVTNIAQLQQIITLTNPQSEYEVVLQNARLIGVDSNIAHEQEPMDTIGPEITG